MSAFFGFLLQFLPKKKLSRVMGRLMHLRCPQPMGLFLVWAFAKIYKINTAEAAKPVSQYPSIGDFFIRELKPGARPLADDPVVHPADSKISQIGIISDGQMIQAKGLKYSVQEICQDLEAFKKYEGGLFVTYYLCPTDYHRVHAPTDMNIHQVTYAPGELWPVNQWSTHNVRNLFGINERVIIDFKAPQGLATLVLVGATNVGQMSLSFDSQIVTNVPLASGAEVTSSIRKSYAVNLQKGDHVGTFHMGSTVVMIYSKEFCQKAWPDITKNPFQTEWVQKFFEKPVQVGQAFQS